MKIILKMRWVIFGVWIIAAVLLTVFQPDINAILRLRGQGDVSADSPSKIGASILNNMSTATGKNNIIVFFNEDKLTNDDMTQIENGLKTIQADKVELGMDNIVDPFNIPEAKSSILSNDETTLMIPFNLDKKGREVDDIKNLIDSKLTDVKVTYYLTGEDFITNDYLKTTESGVAKSAIITVIFILVILMLRSIVTPIVSLLAVGVSYMCSMGIAAQLIDKLNFPITSLTQMLLILILFGIGTDYNILLFNRFKEELSHGYSIDEAIAITYKTAGKTIFFSILTVFIAFLSLSFAEYGIYQSGTVVAIGTAILLLEILTFTPFIMKTLGKRLFWPSKNTSGHKESKLWETTTTFSVRHPVISTLILLAIIIPSIYFNTQKITFDSLKEMGDSSQAAVGFNIVGDHFSRGQAMPTTVAIESINALDNNESMAVIDQLTERLKSIDGVKQVSSATQPTAEPINAFYISDQTKTVTDGLNATKDGVGKIHDGLNIISKNLTTPDFSSVKDLVKGTGDIQNGLGSMTDGLTQIDSGIIQGAGGAANISDGIGQLKTGLSTINNNISMISSGLSGLQGGYSQLREGYKGIEPQLITIQQSIGGMNQLIEALGGKYSDQLATDEQYLALKLTGSSLETGLAQLNGGLKVLGENYDSLNLNFQSANDGLNQLVQAQAQIVSGLDQLENGATALSDGLNKGSAGQKEIITYMEAMKSGVGKIKDGQKELYDGLTTLSGGMGQLKDGITQSSNGLSDISDGLGKTSAFMSQLTSSKTFFIPKEALTSIDFKKSLDTYMSSDRKTTKLTVILNNDPYSMDAANTIQTINDTLPDVLNGTVLSYSRLGTAGPSSVTNDMNRILTSDLNRTKVIILICVFLVLLLIIRSFWIPTYIIGALLGAYYIGMNVTNFVVQNIFKLEGTSSYIPFFVFIIIVSLGVDYSIFLLMRYKEYPELSPKEAIILASKNVGGVVLSAGIILGGTFATLMPSGLYLLIELAIAVIVGLVTLCFVFLPILLPALIALQDNISKSIKKDR